MGQQLLAAQLLMGMLMPASGPATQRPPASAAAAQLRAAGPGSRGLPADDATQMIRICPLACCTMHLNPPPP
jgi:hypothetical protein